MLVFDELKKNDPQLRFVAMALAAGFFILFAGLWWVQIVSAGEYQSHLETQSYRTVRIPAMRGKILDCEGRVLAENTARYNLSLYFDGLTGQFQDEYDRLRQEEYGRPQPATANDRPFWKFWARSTPKNVPLTKDQIEALRWQARYAAGYDIVAQMGQTIGRPLTFDSKDFGRAYQSSLYVPYPIVEGLNAVELARFEENYSGGDGVDLDVQTTRIYPYGTTASQVLGYVQKDDSSLEGEDSFFNYRLPDYRGVIGIEGGFNKILHGRAGEESVLVNYQGFRQPQSDENTGSEPEPGHNVVLTIDLDIQRAAEQSLAQHQNADARGAIVVINVHTGEILAMVSSPAIDPNYFARNLPPDQMQKESEMLDDTNLLPQLNRATQTFDAPGSIFKPIVGLAALENGLNPHEIYNVQENPTSPGHGCIYVGKRKIGDLVPPGPYDFDSAIAHSSNSYFIFNGLRTGIEKIIALGDKFHFGERTDLPTGQDGRGHFPATKDIRDSDWHDGDSANICIGQGELAVTPIQMAVAYSAIANGGTILWPQLVRRIESQDPDSGEESTDIPSGVVRDYLGVHQRSLDILRGAMLKETIEGSGTLSKVAGLQICGKTGTAQVQNQSGVLVKHNFWFASFAPYEDPKYAVVVTVEKPASYAGFGGTVCAPIAHDIYKALIKKGYLVATPTTEATANGNKQNG
jgi:penicillin-binding protein 2